MAQMSDYLEEQLINHVFRGIPYTTPGVIHLALYSTDPTDADGGTELEVGTSPGYARITITMGAPTDGVSANTAELLFAAATGNWVAISHIGIRDESSAGNLLAHKALSAPVSVLSGNNFRVPVSDLEITFA